MIDESGSTIEIGSSGSLVVSFLQLLIIETGSSTFTTGQNYPAGKVGASKEFRVDVR